MTAGLAIDEASEFRESDYIKYGVPAEEELMRLLPLRHPGATVVPHPFGLGEVDSGVLLPRSPRLVTVKSSGGPLYYEAHGRGEGSWPSGMQDFPYPKVHVPQRYVQHMKRYGNTYYWAMFSADLCGCGIIPGLAVLALFEVNRLTPQYGNRGLGYYVDVSAGIFEWLIGTTPTGLRLHPRLL